MSRDHTHTNESLLDGPRVADFSTLPTRVYTYTWVPHWAAVTMGKSLNNARIITHWPTTAAAKIRYNSREIEATNKA